MTTLVLFTPSTTSPFTFQPTLDGTNYTAAVTWNLSGQRWYFNLYTLAGDLVVALPLIGSPPDHDVDLVGGYFTSTVVFRQSSQQFEIDP